MRHLERLEPRRLLAADLRTATVVIESNDPDEGTYTFAIQGTAVYASPESCNLVYGGSKWGGQPVPDKTPLLPGGAASFANISSYVHGINAVEVTGSDLQSTTAADFVFSIGNDSDPAGWSAAPTPEVAATTDAVILTWENDAIRNTWLRIEHTPTGEVWYYGNAIGETGDAGTPGAVLAADLVAIRDAVPGLHVAIDNPLDIDRDGFVLTPDVIACRDNIPFTLELIEPPLSGRDLWERAFAEYLTAMDGDEDEGDILPRVAGWMA